jgi:hypothetical protein
MPSTTNSTGYVHVEELISGEGLQELADVYLGHSEDFVYNPRIHQQSQKQVCLDSLLTPYNNPPLLFCYSHRLNELYEKICFFQNKFVLMTHNSDGGVESFHPLLSSPKLVKWYAQNITVFHPKIVPLPIGIANEQWAHGEQFLNFMRTHQSAPFPKTEDVYFHFSIGTNEGARRPCHDSLLARGIPFLPSLSPTDNLNRLATYRYCVCPPGNGIDTHRFWEALYVHCVPIVVDSPWTRVLRYHYPDLPVVVLSAWNELDLSRLPQYDTFDFTACPTVPNLHQKIHRSLLLLGCGNGPEASSRNEPSIVLVSVGVFQEYMVDNIKQLLKLGHENRVYVLTNAKFFSRLDAFAGRIHLVGAEKFLDMDSTEFNANRRIKAGDRQFREGFWVHTSSRFFLIYYMMRDLGLEHVFHIENDVLLYHSVDDIFTCVDPSYLYLPFDSPDRNIASIVYLPSHDVLRTVLQKYDFSKNDMQNFSHIRASTGLVRSFPIFPSGEDPALDAVTKHFHDFGGMVFDAAAMGQYLGGVDPRNIPGNTTGFVNETCLVKYNQYKFYWDHGKPFLRISPTFSVPIFNLHIHSKRLSAFTNQ